jgi:hypothetical protein
LCEYEPCTHDAVHARQSYRLEFLRSGIADQRTKQVSYRDATLLHQSMNLFVLMRLQSERDVSRKSDAWRVTFSAHPVAPFGGLSSGTTRAAATIWDASSGEPSAPSPGGAAVGLVGLVGLDVANDVGGVACGLRASRSRRAFASLVIGAEGVAGDP